MIKKILTCVIALLITFAGIGNAQNSTTIPTTFEFAVPDGLANMFGRAGTPKTFKINNVGDVLSTATSETEYADLRQISGMDITIEVVEKLSLPQSGGKTVVLEYIIEHNTAGQFPTNQYTWRDTVQPSTQQYIPELPTDVGGEVVDSLFTVVYNSNANLAKGDKVTLGFTHNVAINTTDNGELTTVAKTREEALVGLGVLYICGFDSIVGNTNTIQMGIFPASSNMDTYIYVQGTGAYRVQLFEAPTDSIFGDTLTVQNMNRDTDKTSSVTFTKNLIPKVNGDGTELIPWRGAGIIGGFTGNNFWRLDSAFKYYLKVSSGAATNGISIQVLYN